MQKSKIRSKKIGIEFIENVAEFRYFGTRITVRNSVNWGDREQMECGKCV